MNDGNMDEFDNEVKKSLLTEPQTHEITELIIYNNTNIKHACV